MSAKAAHGKTAARKKPGLRDAERDASPSKLKIVNTELRVAF